MSQLSSSSELEHTFIHPSDPTTRQWPDWWSPSIASSPLARFANVAKLLVHSSSLAVQISTVQLLIALLASVEDDDGYAGVIHDSQLCGKLS